MIAAPGPASGPRVRTASRWPATVAEWVVFAVLAAGLFGLFHGTAAALGSDRGQHGVLVALVVLAALVVAERWLSGEPFRDCAAKLGLGMPRARGLLVAAALAVLLLAFVPLYLRMVGARLALLDGWKGSVVGLFAQAGIAEEALFRGFFFRRLRPARSFPRAVVLSSGPFVLAHLPLFAILPWQLAAASLGLAAATSFSLARFFELGGRTVWPPAVVHFVVQGTVKVLALGALPPHFPILWMIASAIVPLLVFGVPSEEVRYRRKAWWSRRDSNPRPPRCERGALPAELLPHGSPVGRESYTRVRGPATDGESVDWRG